LDTCLELGKLDVHNIKKLPLRKLRRWKNNIKMDQEESNCMDMSPSIDYVYLVAASGTNY
jgi:hypothetical protein